MGLCGVAGMFEEALASLEPQVTSRAGPHVVLLCGHGQPHPVRAGLHSVCGVSATRGASQLLPGHAGGKSVRNEVIAPERGSRSPTREARQDRQGGLHAEVQGAGTSVLGKEGSLDREGVWFCGIFGLSPYS